MTAWTLAAEAFARAGFLMVWGLYGWAVAALWRSAGSDPWAQACGVGVGTLGRACSRNPNAGGLSVERIGASEARDHMEMVERILAESQQRLCSGGEYFVVWGIIGAFITVIVELVDRQPDRNDRAVVDSDRHCRRHDSFRSCALGRRGRSSSAARSCSASFSTCSGSRSAWRSSSTLRVFRIFTGIAGAAIWSVAQAIVLFYIGMHGNRRAQIAGILVVASLIAANFSPPEVAGYVLAAGMLAGYTGFGISELLAAE